MTPSLTPQMVLDINPGPPHSNPSQMVAIGSTTYFNADDGVHGVELWKSDGTADGTVLVRDINPGGAESSPRELTNVNGTLFFNADDGANGRELWKSDGTASGTVLVDPGAPPWSNPYFITSVNGTLFFSGYDVTRGWELWKSDGTAVGTTFVNDIWPGGRGSYPDKLTNVDGMLFFTDEDSTHGRELWKSDGTVAGTTLVKDINPGGAESSPRELTNVNGTLFFNADDGANGRELWKSDGTASGTVLVDPGAPPWSNPYFITSVNGTLFFSGYDVTRGWELWTSDGTAAGTTLVNDIWPGGRGSYPDKLTNVDGTLFFSDEDSTHGRELWKSDGTAAGTTFVKDIYPGTHFEYDYYGNPYVVQNHSFPSYLTNVNGTLFFVADDGTNGRELWKSDGTEAGTVRVANLVAGSLVNVNGTLFFSGDDGVHGQELWVLVDGQTQGTNLGVSGFPATITAGTAGNFTVIAKNADGTTNTEYRGTVHFTSSDPQAVLPGNYTFTEADQGMHTFTATLKTAGSQCITTRDVLFTGSAGTQAGITVNPAAASRFTLAGFPSAVTAGVAGSFSVTAWDAYGNRATGYTGTVHFTSTDVQAVLPGNYTFTAADQGHHTFSATLKTAGSQSITASDMAVPGGAGTQAGITVTPAPTSSFALAGFPSAVTAGVAGNFTVIAKNADGTTNTEYRGTVHFTSSDPQAVLPGNYTFTEADQGMHTFTATLKTAGSQSVTARDILFPGSAGTQTGIAVNAAAASRLTVAGFPSPVTAGVVGSFTVTAWDAYGNRATGYRGTVHFTSSDAQVVLPGNYTFTAADSGTHTFNAVLKTAGTQSLTATDAATAAVAGAQSVTVNPAAASRLLVSAPTSVNANAQFSLTVTVVDAYGNVVTGYRGTITFRSSDRASRLPRNYTFTAADQGVHTFTDLVLKKRGRQTITVADTLISALTTTVSMDVS